MPTSPEDRHLKIAGITVSYVLAIVLLIPAVGCLLISFGCCASLVIGAGTTPTPTP